MNYINLKPRAKINISIDVINRLDNGYHNIEMIMQTVNLHDNLFIKKINKNQIILKTNLFWLPTDQRNLVYKAAQILKERYGIKEGIYLDLYKRIPVSAGLAGGSSDCASALVGIRNLFRLPISNKQLMAIGKELGADIPFCMMRGTALAQGIGEKLTRLTTFPKCYVLIVKPSVIVSTAGVFNDLDLSKLTQRPDTEKIIYYINNNDLQGICDNMFNVLETVTANKYPIINELKEFMITNGALGSIMSGSGPTVFGIFDDKQKGMLAHNKVKEKFNISECFLTKIFNLY